MPHVRKNVEGVGDDDQHLSGKDSCLKLDSELGLFLFWVARRCGNTP